MSEDFSVRLLSFFLFNSLPDGGDRGLGRGDVVVKFNFTAEVDDGDLVNVRRGVVDFRVEEGDFMRGDTRLVRKGDTVIMNMRHGMGNR